MHPERERVHDDEVYELDRKAWNLPQPRPKLTIVPLPEAARYEVSGLVTHARGDTETAA
jgi:hypothetical protein